MATTMTLFITLRKNVADEAEGETLTQIVRSKLSQYPEINISAHVTTFIENQVPE